MAGFEYSTYLVTTVLLAFVWQWNGIAAEENVTLSAETAVSSTLATNTTTATTTNRPFLPVPRLPCSCVEGQCGCCTGAILDRFRQKVCMNFTYEPDDFAFTASMTMNDRVFYKNTVSGKNPPPMCVRIPRLQFIKLCVRLSNVYFASRNMHVCVDMEANWEQVTLVEWSFDCIRMGASGFAVVPPEEGGGLPAAPIDEEEQTDEDYDDSARLAVPIKEAHNRGNLIFESSLKQIAMKEPDKTTIGIERLKNGDLFFYYVPRKDNKKKAQ